MTGVSKLIERYAKAAPIAVMARGTLEQVLADEKLDAVFANHAIRQYVRKLTFSSCFWLMAEVVTKAQPSLNAAFQEEKENLQVTVQSIYNKINKLELGVLEKLLSSTASEMIACTSAMKTTLIELVPGYVCRLVDGNILPGTQHRIQELRHTNAAALPGRSVCIFNYSHRIIDEVVLDTNGHAQDKSQIDKILICIRPGECIIADAGFCTQKMMYGISKVRQAYFVFRKPSNTAVERIGTPKRIGKSETGILFEQKGILHCKNKESIPLRVITLKRFKPTSLGKEEIVFLTNLPSTVSAITVAQAYRRRWKIENTFQDLAQVVASEISTLGYPSAALFGFVVGCVIQNLMAVIEHALQKAAQKPKQSKTTGAKKEKTSNKDKQLSRYKIALEIRTIIPGMEIAIEPPHWTKACAPMSPQDLAKWMLDIAKNAKLEDYETCRWTPKRKQPARASGNRGNHIATSQLLEKRKKKRKPKHL